VRQKIKAGEFIVEQNKQFDEDLNETEINAWLSFKHVICAVIRILPLMKLTSSEVNFGRREVVNPSSALFSSTLSFTTLG
jgi:hypothetical protein